MTMLKLVLAGAALVAPLIVLVPAGESPASVRVAIEGMTCEGCASKIGKAVAALGGVEEAALDVKGGYADVVFASARVSPREIVRAIEDAGYAAAALPQKGGAPPPNPKLDEIRAQLVKAKNGLMREGKYSCCISPSCDFCALSVNGCVCGDNLAKGKPVCGECKGGWTAGFGMNPDIDPKDVKALPDAELKQMYRSRSDLVKNSKLPGDKKE